LNQPEDKYWRNLILVECIARIMKQKIRFEMRRVNSQGGDLPIRQVIIKEINNVFGEGSKSEASKPEGSKPEGSKSEASKSEGSKSEASKSNDTWDSLKISLHAKFPKCLSSDEVTH